MKIDNIVSTEEITTKDGTKLSKTKFLSGGQLYSTFAKVAQGEDREEESRRESNYNGQSEITVKFKSKGGFGGFGGGKRESDPNTMLLSYAKDIAVAGIASGMCKTLPDAIKTLEEACDAIQTKYNKMKGETPAPTVPSATSSSGTGTDDINLEDLPF